MSTNNISVSPKIYHIVHIDNLPSIISNGFLFCDAHFVNSTSYTNIGIRNIKQRRLKKPLNSYPDLHVGDCVPFYFCPRSVMLYLYYCDDNPNLNANIDITYHGGQTPIIHLQADLCKVVDWAKQNNLRWAFTDSNAGSSFFDDFNKLDDLKQLNWQAINADYWHDCKDEKQAEFLIEKHFPWHLVEYIGVISSDMRNQVNQKIATATHKPQVVCCSDWYY